MKLFASRIFIWTALIRCKAEEYVAERQIEPWLFSFLNEIVKCLLLKKSHKNVINKKMFFYTNHDVLNLILSTNYIFKYFFIRNIVASYKTYFIQYAEL